MASKFKPSVCSCESCKQACRKRPCWATPKDATALINAGYGARLMNDWWNGDGVDGNDIQIISPAIVGHEGGYAPSHPRGRCTFLTSDDLCELHALRLKPFEGRVSNCKRKQDTLHWNVAKSWNTEIGRSVVKRWKGSRLIPNFIKLLI